MSALGAGPATSLGRRLTSSRWPPSTSRYGTHTHDNVVAWLDKHPRFHLHFIPTSSSWLNMVERWFRELTEKAIRRGVFKSVPDLIAAIEAYLQANNNDPKPFVWTATAEEILEKVSRGRVALASIPANNESPHRPPDE